MGSEIKRCAVLGQTELTLFDLSNKDCSILKSVAIIVERVVQRDIRRRLRINALHLHSEKFARTAAAHCLAEGGR